MGERRGNPRCRVLPHRAQGADAGDAGRRVGGVEGHAAARNSARGRGARAAELRAPAQVLEADRHRRAGEARPSRKVAAHRAGVRQVHDRGRQAAPEGSCPVCHRSRPELQLLALCSDGVHGPGS